MSNNNTMKVRVTKADNNNWYKAGDEHIVLVEPRKDRHSGDYFHPTVENGIVKGWGVGVDNFEIVKTSEPKKPHKWATEIHAFADGCKIQSKPVGGGDWSTNNNPNWGDVGMEYRVSKGPDFPKTQLEADFLMNYYCEQDNDTAAEDLKVTVDMALQHFVESGQMDAYIKERDNANN